MVPKKKHWPCIVITGDVVQIQYSLLEPTVAPAAPDGKAGMGRPFQYPSQFKSGFLCLSAPAKLDRTPRGSSTLDFGLYGADLPPQVSGSNYRSHLSTYAMDINPGGQSSIRQSNRNFDSDRFRHIQAIFQLKLILSALPVGGRHSISRISRLYSVSLEIVKKTFSF